MQEALHEHWRIRNNLIYGKGNEDVSDSEDEEKEYSLNATSNIICYKCGKKGRKANQC